LTLELYPLIVAFATIAGTIFVVELTDKDALLLLALATRIKPWTAFASGATAFTITSAIIVSLGYLLIRVVPIFWVRLAGGLVMIGFGLWEYFRREGEEKEEQSLLGRTINKGDWSIFLGAVSLLVLLDLAGDATEVLTIVYVARFSDVLLVFVGAVTALVSASALETFLGGRLARILPTGNIRKISLVIFLIIGTLVIVTTIA
jgi:putative Ca2+/H+ antiporter (TMEM165/GDT1 family)